MAANGTDTKIKVHLLDYVAGNIRSLVNAIERVGGQVEWIRTPDQVKDAEVWQRNLFILINSSLDFPEHVSVCAFNVDVSQ